MLTNHYAFNQEKALLGAFSVITNLRMDLRFKPYRPQRTQRDAPPAHTARHTSRHGLLYLKRYEEALIVKNILCGHFTLLEILSSEQILCELQGWFCVARLLYQLTP